jgi:hypothetical protein
MLLAASQHAPTFNFNFYLAAATVIPVLFLALAVQGHTYKNMLERARRTAENTLRQYETARLLPRNGPRRTLTDQADVGCITGCATLLGAVLILFFGSIGEITAISALSNQQSNWFENGLVGFATVYLALAVAGYPILLLFRNLAATVRIQRKVTDIWVEVAHEEQSREVRALLHGIRSVFRSLRNRSDAWSEDMPDEDDMPQRGQTGEYSSDEQE